MALNKNLTRPKSRKPELAMLENYMLNLTNWIKIVGITMLLVASTSILVIPQASASNVTCGEEITTSTTLTANVGPCPSSGIIIDANNIIFNCNGYTISGKGSGDGIDVNPDVTLLGSGVTIEDCTVTSFHDGFNIGFGNDRVLSNIANENAFGISIFTYNSLISNNMATNNAQGFIFNGGSALDGSNNVVTNNVALKNGGHGFNFNGGGNGDRITNNQAENNGGDGFYFQPSWSGPATVTNNIAVKNGLYGYIDATTGSGTKGTADTYIGNLCVANAEDGSIPTGLCSGQ